MMDSRLSQLRSRLRDSFSALLVSLLLASCVPPESPVEAPVVGEPDIGTVDDNVGFRLLACRSVNGTACSQGNYLIHAKGKRNTPCVVLPDATTTSIDCVAEAPELDLVFFGAQLNYNVPKSMCEYLAVRPYHYWRNEPGTGPASITVRKTSSGTVVRRLVNERIDITPGQVEAKTSDTQALTLTSLTSISDISTGTPLVFYRGDARSTTGVVATRTGNAPGSLTLTAATVTMTDGGSGFQNLSPETETLKIYVSESSPALKFRAIGTISGNIGPFTLSNDEFVVAKSVSGTERKLVRLVFSGDASLLALGDNFTVVTNADPLTSSVDTPEEGRNVGNGTVSGITVGPGAHHGDVYTVSITAAATNGGAFSVTKTPGSYGSAAILPSGNVGTTYSGENVSFLVTDGATDFVPGDKFSFTITADELPNGLSEGTSYTVTSTPPASVVISPASGGTNLNGNSAVGTFVFGLAPSDGVTLNTGAAIHPVSGAATCDYDYSTAGGQNCCSGSYTLYNETVGQASRPAGSVQAWGGSSANCLAGPAMDSQSKTASGFPLGSLFDVADTGKNDVYSVPASSPIDGKSVRQANYTRITLTGDSDGPVGMQKFEGYRPTRHYEFICYDSAQEQKAKIRVQIREWNDSTKLANYKACTTLDTAGTNCDGLHPDNNGSAGPDTATVDVAECLLNDSHDWDDIIALFPDEASGASACTMSLKGWLKSVKAQGFLKDYLK